MIVQDKLINKVVRSSIALALGTFCLAWPVDTADLYFTPHVAEAYAAQRAVVTGKYVNLRSGPGTNHTIVGRVYQGDRLTVLGQQQDWYKVRNSSGKTAWIAGWLIKLENTALPVSRAGTFRGRMLVVTAADVNLRGGPGTNYPVLGMVDKGDRLPVTAQKENWYRVKLSSGREAWIAGWLVKIDDSALSRSSAAGKTAVVTATDVNLRGGPGTSYPVLGIVDRGDKLPVIGQKGDWLHVEIKNGDAWIAGWLVKLESTSSAAATTAAKTAVVTATDVNLRGGPGTTYPVLGMVDKGDKLPVLSQKNSWYQVKTSSGKTAWIAGWLVKVQEGKVPTSSPSKPLGSRKEAVITATDVNVRSGPGISYQVLGMVDEGERYQWLGSSGQWYKVKLPTGEVGWIAGWLAKIEEAKEQDLASRGESSRDSQEDLISWLPPEAQEPMDEDQWGDQEDGEVETKNSLLDIDIDEEDDKTVITVEADAPLKYNTFMLSNPHRLVINFEGVKLGDLPEDEKVGSESVIKYRTGQFSENPVISRVVLDLTGPVHYSTSTSDGGRVVTIETKLTEYDQNVEGKLIFIDPGHGGKDPGAPGYSRRTWEDEINLDIALKLAAILRQQGAEVVLSRYSDRTVDLYQRPKLANNANADIFVSIHSNANPNPATRGTSTYYYAPYNKPQLYEQLADRRRLAQCIQTEMVNYLKLPDKGIRQANYAVLRVTSMPSVLVETAYMSNPQEEKLLSDSNFRQKVAEAIARGLNAYFADK